MWAPEPLGATATCLARRCALHWPVNLGWLLILIAWDVSVIFALANFLWIPKKKKNTHINIVMSVFPLVITWEPLTGISWNVNHKVLLKFVGTFRFWLMCDRNNGMLHVELRMFLLSFWGWNAQSRNVYPSEQMFRTEVLNKCESRFLCSAHFFSKFLWLVYKMNYNAMRLNSENFPLDFQLALC
jgi:hypothetical protein